MQLNAEGFVDEVLLYFPPKFLNETLENIKEGHFKASNLFYRSVKYGLSLAQSQICIEYFLQRIEKILGKSIEQIGENQLTNLLDKKILANLRNEFIEFVENYPVEDRTTNDLNCEKITRLNIAMCNMTKELSDVFSNEVIAQKNNFFSYIIDENKIDEINFICNMIDNLSLDNITDDTATKYAKLVIFINDFMFRKNNITKFIDTSFDYNIEILYGISKNWSYLNGLSFVNNYHVYKPAIENYAQFLLDSLKSILGHPIDLNSDKKINELLDQGKLNILKEKAITFIENFGAGFYDYEMINRNCTFYIYIDKKSSCYFNNDFFDMKTPISLIKQMDTLGKKFLRIEQAKQIDKLAYYFHNMIPTNPTQFTNEEIKNVIKYFIKILEINYDKLAINSVLNSKSAKILLSKINETRIEIYDLNNFFTEFNNKHPGVMREPIPQQTNLSNQRNL